MLNLKKLFDETYSYTVDYDLYVPFDLKINYTKNDMTRGNYYCINIGSSKSILEIYIESSTGRVNSITLVSVDPNKRRLGTIKNLEAITVIDKVPGLSLDWKMEKENDSYVNYVNCDNDFEVVLSKTNIVIVFQSTGEDRVITKMRDILFVFDQELKLSKIFLEFPDKNTFEFLKKTLYL